MNKTKICKQCNSKRAIHLFSKVKKNICVWCSGEKVELKSTFSLGTKRNYNICLHLEKEKMSDEGKCLLYHFKKCSDVNHRDLTQCAYINKEKFRYGDKNWEKVLKKSLELFFGENIEPVKMNVCGKEIEISPKPKNYQLLTKKEKRRTKLQKNLSNLLTFEIEKL